LKTKLPENALTCVSKPGNMKRTWFWVVIILLAAIAGGMVGSILTFRLVDFSITPYVSVAERQTLFTTYRTDSLYRLPRELDFRASSGRVIPGVVHIRASYGPGAFSLNPLEYYYQNPTRSSGSGVIISDDGYIVTNYHVIEEATNIEVVMNNNQRFFAKIIGTDPSTDLALLKVRARGLPFVRYGDSDLVTPGQWVLAIGNPFDLNSTVTAGIVSAKARNIGILRDRNNLQVESFIQTDAAVNPGNSGGALVNLQGELVGINTAIATSTGQYSGYSFAIPVSLVKKVVDDLVEFGQVQRGLLGVQITDVDANISEQLNLPVNQGVLINRVNRGSAADASGLRQGDVITAIDRHRVTSVSELQEWVARKRPGKEVEVTYWREGSERLIKSRLKNNAGEERLNKREVKTDINGITIRDVLPQDLVRLKLEGGVWVTSVTEGKFKDAGIQPDFIIAFLDRVPVDNAEDLNRLLEYKRGGVLLEGYYLTGEKKSYGLDW
jgi:Do/DeqQ family serine protease